MMSLVRCKRCGTVGNPWRNEFCKGCANELTFSDPEGRAQISRESPAERGNRISERHHLFHSQADHARTPSRNDGGPKETQPSRLLKRLIEPTYLLLVYCFIAYVMLSPVVIAYRQATEGVSTQATIQSQEFFKGDGESIDVWKYELAYDGHHRTIEARMDYEPGTKVSVVYLKDNPDHVALGTPNDSWWNLYVSGMVSADGHESAAMVFSLAFWIVILVLPPLVLAVGVGRACIHRLAGPRRDFR